VSLHGLGLVIIPAPMIVYFSMGDMVRGILQLGIWIITLVVLLGLRRGLPVTTSAHVMCLMFLGSICVEAVLGEGMHEPVVVVVIIVPFVHTFVAKSELSWAWCLAALGVLAGLVAVTPGPMERSVHQAVSIAAVMLAVTGGAALFERSRRINMQALRDATRRAEAATSVKSRFLATMSHEIRTPLNGVLGMLTILRDSRLTPDQLEHVRTARVSGMVLLDLINDVLDFSKIEAGHMKIEHGVFDLRELVEDVLDQVAVRANNKGVALVSRYAPETATLVQGDAGRVRQVLLNLVNNAVKFTAEGHVRTVVHRDATASEPVFHLAVEDTGAGITPADQQRVFEQFQQVEGSRASNLSGTGLGLAIVRELTTLMGGRVGLHSTPGEGSTFWVELPLALVDALLSPPVDASGHRVLLADDRPIVRASLRAPLEAWGAEVKEAGTDLEALEIMRAASRGSQPVRVAFISEQRPGMEELGRAIEADDELRDTRRVMVVPITHRSEAQRRLEAGGPDYVVEPVRWARLRQIFADPGAEAVEPVAVSLRAESVARGRRILLVEDNAVNRTVALHLLEQLGADVHVAGDGEEALERTESTAYDLVLMDVEMPRMDGLQATTLIRQREREREGKNGARVPIVAMTAHVHAEVRERCRAVGIDGYVGKPIMRDDLVTALLAHLPA